MENQEFKDRRIFDRIPTKLHLRYLNRSSNKSGFAQTRDISANGIGLITEEDLTPETSLEIWLEIPDKGEPLYTRGEVVWSEELQSNKYRAGVQLDKVDFMGMSRVMRTL